MLERERYLLHVEGKDIHSLYNPWQLCPSSFSTTVEEVGSSFTVSYTVGGWTGRRVRDIVHIGDSSFSVTFDLIQEAYNGFFVTGAEWVGIWGMAFSELAKVRLCVCLCSVVWCVWCVVCVHAYICVYVVSQLLKT